MNDEIVPIKNSVQYVERLTELGVPVEFHLFPDGRHGLGLADENPHVAVWSELLRRWLTSLGWINS